jgi:hypothetical protein
LEKFGKVRYLATTLDCQWPVVGFSGFGRRRAGGDALFLIGAFHSIDLVNRHGSLLLY